MKTILTLGTKKYFEVDMDHIRGMTFEELNSFKSKEVEYTVLKFDKDSEAYPAEDIFSSNEIGEMEVIASIKDIAPFYRTLDGELIWVEKIKNKLVWHNY